MTDRLIWTRDDIVRFTHDPRDEARSWAWVWLLRHHPEEGGRQAARGLRDPVVHIAMEALLLSELHPTPEAAATIEELLGRDDLDPKLRAEIERSKDPRTRRPLERGPEEYERLSRSPKELRRRAGAMLLGKSHDDYLCASSALATQQHTWATEIILTHFAALLTIRDDMQIWFALDELCDPDSLPAIRAAWVPGERRTACIYERIHARTGRTAPLPEGIARDVEARARAYEEQCSFMAAHPEEPWPGMRHHKVCRMCRRTGEYDLISTRAPTRRPEMSPRVRAFVEEEVRVVICNFCGAKNTHWMGPLSPLDAIIGNAVEIENDEDEDTAGPS